MTSKEYWRARYEKDFKPAYDALMKWYPFTLEDLDGEEWKPVPGYEDYHVSTYGRVKSFKYIKVKILRPALNHQGYLSVLLCKHNKPQRFRLNRLVALVFIENPDNKPEVNHIDGHTLNNFIDNLAWATGAENMEHAARTGLVPFGQRHHRAKLTNEQIELIRNNPKNLTGVQLAEKFNVSPSNICLIQLGKNWKSGSGELREKKDTRFADELRKKIRAEYVKGSVKFGTVALARKYEISQRTVWRIVHEEE